MKIAGVQIDIQLARPAVNLRRICEFLRETSAAGSQLTVFPECALTGYGFESLDEARPHAQSVPGPATQQVAEVCAEYGSYVVFGLLEADRSRLFNAAVLVGPTGLIACYRKVHLPFIGIDRFADHGDRPFAVHAADQLKLGVNICYDVSFPEAARCLTLLGADLVALPTNWPTGAQCVAQSTVSCRALENTVYFLAVNRVGTERGFSFIGQSQLCDPGGQTLHRASRDQEEVFYAQIDPQLARQKHVVRVPGKHELHRLADRRPAMYAPLTQPHDLTPPGRESSSKKGQMGAAQPGKPFDGS